MLATSHSARTASFPPAAHASTGAAPADIPLMIVHGEDLTLGTELVNNLAGQVFSSNKLIFFTLGDGTQTISLRDVTRSTKDYLTAQGHLIIHVHGNDCHGSHHLLMANGKLKITRTRELLGELRALAPSCGDATDGSGITRPMVHLTACDAKILRRELSPDSPEWKAGYLMLYSRTGTFIEQYQSSLQTALHYVASCRQRAIACDPLKLFFMAGQKRGHCLTLMGGTLEAPLVWHSPKTLDDLRGDRLYAKLEGSQNDKARLTEAAAQLDAEDISCMSAITDNLIKQNMLFDRIATDNVEGMLALLRAHPEQLHAKGLCTESPLLFALEFKDNPCAIKLIDLQADVNFADKDGFTPLMVAARSNSSKAIIRLLINRADINKQDHEGNTALMYAVSARSHRAIRILMQYRADILLRNERNQSALSLARELDDDNETLKVLVEKCN